MLDQTILNPLNPNSDQHQISPCNISAHSIPKVMRIKDMITQGEYSWCYTALIHSIQSMFLWMDGSIPVLRPGAPSSLIEGIDPAEQTSLNTEKFFGNEGRKTKFKLKNYGISCPISMEDPPTTCLNNCSLKLWSTLWIDGSIPSSRIISWARS